MDDDAEVIRHQMQETRSSLTDKIERLEQTVTQKVQTTTAAVTDTVESVKGAVQDTVQTVKGTVNDTVDTVKEAFNVRRYFEEYPWAAFGAAVGAGFAGGVLLGTGAHARGDRITELHSRGRPYTGPNPSNDGGCRNSVFIIPAYPPPGACGRRARRATAGRATTRCARRSYRQIRQRTKHPVMAAAIARSAADRARVR